MEVRVAASSPGTDTETGGLVAFRLSVLLAFYFPIPRRHTGRFLFNVFHNCGELSI